MSRQPRINAPGTIHHVVNRGVNRQSIFFGDPDFIEFGRLIGEIHERFGITIIAYCLMDNHYHLIVHCPDGHLSDAMHHLQSVLASHVNDRNERDGPLFTGRFYSALITSDRYLVTATRYVERNSLAIPGIAEPAQYRWSSVRARLGLKTAPTWLERARILDYFPDTEAYYDFLCTDIAADEPEHLELDDVGDLARLMITLFADDDVRTAQLERTVIAAVADSLGDANRVRVGDYLGFDARRLRRATARAMGRIERDPSVGIVVDNLRERLFDISGPTAENRAA